MFYVDAEATKPTDTPPMGVLVLTIFLSLVLVSLFLVLFLRERRKHGFRSSEQDALLPFEDEDPRSDS